MINQLIVIVIGLAVGGMARGTFLRRAQGGLPLALLLGMAGAMFAAFLAQTLWPHNQEMLPFLAAGAGSAMLLFGYRLDLSRVAGGVTSPHDLNLRR